MYLIINSSQPDFAFVALADKKSGVVFLKKVASKNGKRPVLLKEIDAMFLKKNLTSKKIKGIVVATGPGHFSFLRTGIVIANTFGWVLNIPIVGIEGDSLSAEQLWERGGQRIITMKGYVPVMPEYGREPNITIGKQV